MTTSNFTPNGSSNQPTTRICSSGAECIHPDKGLYPDGLPLTAEYFHKDSKSKSGFSYACKECAKARSRKNVADNRERNKENGRNFRKNNPDYRKQYDEEHAEKRAIQKRDWRKKNADKVKKQKSESQKRHRDSANKRVKRHYINHPESIHQHNHQRLARRKGLIATFTTMDWNRCLEYWDYRCAYCGRPRGLFHTLAQDHFVAESAGGNYIVSNIIPACHGKKDSTGGEFCNNSKSDRDAEEWLISKLGYKAAMEKLESIRIYFEWAIAQKESSNV